MKRKSYIHCWTLLLFAAFLATAGPVMAALGESADSIVADRKALSAAQGVTTAPKSYSVQEIISASTTVREYISPDKTVFGVAWNGLSTPDLTQLLGSYAGEYHRALQSTPRKHGRRVDRITTNRLVVERWGHMRNLRGRAFVPDLIPPGVSVDDIK
jgi:hypothetical protein